MTKGVHIASDNFENVCPGVYLCLNSHLMSSKEEVREPLKKPYSIHLRNNTETVMIWFLVVSKCEIQQITVCVNNSVNTVSALMETWQSERSLFLQHGNLVETPWFQIGNLKFPNNCIYLTLLGLETTFFTRCIHLYFKMQIHFKMQLS